MQHRLQRNEQRNTERQHDYRNQRRGGDRQGGHDLVFGRAGLCADDVARVHSAGYLHVDKVARYEGKIAAACAEHRGVNKKLDNAADRPHKADGQKCLAHGADIGHRAEYPAYEKRSAHEHDERYRRANAADNVRALIVAFKIIVVHCAPPYINSLTTTAAAMPISMLPAIEKLSTHARFFFSERYMNPAITSPETNTTISGIKLPENENRPPP